MMFVEAIDELRNFDVMSFMSPFRDLDGVTSSRVMSGVMTIGGVAEINHKLLFSIFVRDFYRDCSGITNNYKQIEKRPLY